MATHLLRQALFVIAISAAAVVAVQADEVPGLPRHTLVYVSHRDASRTDYDIWRMCSDGTQIASLVVEAGQQSQFSISPDGNEIVYTTRHEGRADIWRRKFDGGKAENLTQNAATDSGPVFSPDGKRIAFFSDRDAKKPELYVMVASNLKVTRLTTNEHYDSGANWLPDGKSIVLTRYFAKTPGKYDGAGEIIKLELASGQETQLTKLGGYNGGLSLSPDGKRIAFHHVDDERVDLWVMNADGSDAKAITNTFIDEYSPAWSPDGNWIVYTAGTENDSRGTFDLWLIRPDGSHPRLINPAPNTQMTPAWRTGDHFCR